MSRQRLKRPNEAIVVLEGTTQGAKASAMASLVPSPEILSAEEAGELEAQAEARRQEAGRARAELLPQVKLEESFDPKRGNFGTYTISGELEGMTAIDRVSVKVGAKEAVEQARKTVAENLITRSLKKRFGNDKF